MRTAVEVRDFAELQPFYLQAVGMFQVMQHPSEGPITYVRPATKFADTPANVRHQAPVLGQDTAAILGELGYDAAEIAALAEKKVIVRGK